MGITGACFAAASSGDTLEELREGVYGFARGVNCTQWRNPKNG